MAKTHIVDIRRLDRDLEAIKARIRKAVAAADTTVTDIYGVGPVVAAFLIGYSPPIDRFATADRYAAYNGTAPIEVSSGGKVRHRLSRRGNRTRATPSTLPPSPRSAIKRQPGSTTTRSWMKARPRKRPSGHSRGASRMRSTGG
jgi:transposase